MGTSARLDDDADGIGSGGVADDGDEQKSFDHHLQQQPKSKKYNFKKRFVAEESEIETTTRAESVEMKGLIRVEASNRTGY